MFGAANVNQKMGAQTLSIFIPPFEWERESGASGLNDLKNKHIKHCYMCDILLQSHRFGKHQKMKQLKQ
ncbi:MAG: hypothetical protein HXX11_12060 [Desulfuromonadales bacterium]|nr:hypothetical protein [Desulfuromonadales bacterium]